MKLINYNELLSDFYGVWRVCDDDTLHMSIIKKIFPVFHHLITKSYIKYMEKFCHRKLVNTSRIIVLFQLSVKLKEDYIQVYAAKTNNDGFSQKHDVSLVVKYTKTHHQHMLSLIVLCVVFFHIYDKHPEILQVC